MQRLARKGKLWDWSIKEEKTRRKEGRTERRREVGKEGGKKA